MSDVSLNPGIRANLLQLQSSSSLFQRTTQRLASGKKVNSAIDNPTNFFAAVNLTDRAEGLTSRLDGMGQAVQTIKAADNGISTIRSFISAMKGVVDNAISTNSATVRISLGKQFNELIVQVRNAAKDSAYQGINLLQGNATSTIQFNEKFDNSSLNIFGFDLAGPGADGLAVVDSDGNIASAAETAVIQVASQASDASNVSLAARTVTAEVALFLNNQTGGTAIGIQGAGTLPGSVDWGASNYQQSLIALVQQLASFDSELKIQSGALSQNLAAVTIREDFSNNLISILSEGADKLVLADLNEEGANLLALQTSTQLATQSLALASQQAQGVLQLLG
jgi:flagellin